MTTLKLLVSEKSINNQSLSTFTLIADNAGFDINKIELKKLLEADGLMVENINVLNLPRKQKVRNTKRGRTNVAKARPKKFMVKLKNDNKKKINDKFELTIK